MHTIEPTAYGTLYRSETGYHTLMADTCPWCNGPHRHVVTDPDVSWVLRHPRCKPHKSYVIRISKQVGDATAFWPTSTLLKAA